MRLPPAPRETAQKWLAFGAIVFVVVGVSFASSAFKSHLKETLPQPEPPPYFTPSAPAPAPSNPDDPDENAPPAEDEKPEFPATIEASMQTRPAWSPAGVYAPQSSEASTLYVVSGAIDERLWRRFVVCQVRPLELPTSLQGSGELEAHMKVGAGPEVVARSDLKYGVVHVTAPLATLERGESIVMRAFVRRDGKATELARVSAKNAGEDGLSFDHKAVEVDCQTLTISEVDSRVAGLGGRADAALARLSTVKLDSTAPAWHYPKDDLARARKATSDIAALVGWGDPRAKKRIEALATVQAKIDLESERVFNHFYRSATNTALAAGLEVKLMSITCAKRCVAKLNVKNPGDPAQPWATDGAHLYFATKRGGPVFFDHDDSAPKEIPPYAAVVVSVTLPEAFPASDPSLLGICKDARCSTLALR